MSDALQRMLASVENASASFDVSESATQLFGVTTKTAESVHYDVDSVDSVRRHTEALFSVFERLGQVVPWLTDEASAEVQQSFERLDERSVVDTETGEVFDRPVESHDEVDEAEDDEPVVNPESSGERQERPADDDLVDDEAPRPVVKPKKEATQKPKQKQKQKQKPKPEPKKEPKPEAKRVDEPEGNNVVTFENGDYFIPVMQTWSVEVVDQAGRELLSQLQMVQTTLPFDPERGAFVEGTYPEQDVWDKLAVEQTIMLVSQRFGEPVDRSIVSSKSIRYVCAVDGVEASVPQSVKSPKRTMVLDFVNRLPGIENASAYSGTTVNSLLDSGARSAVEDVSTRFMERFVSVANRLRDQLGDQPVELGDGGRYELPETSLSVSVHHDVTPEALADYMFAHLVTDSAQAQQAILASDSDILSGQCLVESYERVDASDFFSKFVKSIYNFKLSR